MGLEGVGDRNAVRQGREELGPGWGLAGASLSRGKLIRVITSNR